MIPQWRLAWDCSEAFVTPLGAMIGPANFELGNGEVVQPSAIAPWSKRYWIEAERAPAR